MRLKIFCSLVYLMPVLAANAQVVNSWLTTTDRSALLEKQPSLVFNDAQPVRAGRSVQADSMVTIRVNPGTKYQAIDGFGFALTGGSAGLIQAMSAASRARLLNELVGRGTNDAGISYLRLSIGSSDMNDHTFSYDDLKPGETDLALSRFTLKEDETAVIPVLKEMLAVSPHIRILASPWSAPLWMKTNGNIQGGKLQEKYYDAYARYFVRYINGMKAHGIIIDAVTIQNEPFNDGNTPSMQFFAKEELRFIRDHLGPVLAAAGLKTKIILYDHNCDAPEYPISILTDAAASNYIDGSGFHLYAGSITALTKVHNAFPLKNLYFTEMMAVSHTDFNTAKPVSRILIGATRNWSRNVILWNLAADKNYNPHTDNGGCGSCQGAITLEGDTVSRNLAYYTIAHFSKFVPPNSIRIESPETDGISNVAFLTPEGKTVLVVANNSDTMHRFTISYKGKSVVSALNAGSTGTYIW